MVLVSDLDGLIAVSVFVTTDNIGDENKHNEDSKGRADNDRHQFART